MTVAKLEMPPSTLAGNVEGECPICAAHLSPVTGEEQFNDETLAAIEEGRAILRGDIPVKWHKPHELEKVWKGLLDGEDADEPSDG